MRHAIHISFALGAAVALWVQGPAASVVLADGENVLFIVADDLGVDVLESYGEGSSFPPTPTLDMLRDGGVLFRNAYSNPSCSPTRATIQTGRYALRTGVGSVVPVNGTNGLPLSETIIPEMLDLNPMLGYHHAAIGKWHLTSDSQGGDDAPNLFGYSHFSGTMRSLDDYFDWPKTENGETADTQVYATTDNANEAIEWINAQGESPWFMWLAFSAPHSPFHAPPDELHTYDLSDNPTGVELFEAMVEALDTEVARLFASIPQDVFDNTNIIFLGDNGTSAGVTLPPFDPLHAKLTLYEGGINVPLIISGPQVASPGSESNVLVNTTDLFATALEMMGVDVEASLPADTSVDSRSVLPLLKNKAFDPRLFAYAERFSEGDPTGGGQAILNTAHFKLIRFNTGIDEFYDLLVDPFETTNLLLGDLDPVQQENLDELIFQLDILSGKSCEGDANGDGTVDPLDAGFVLARFGCPVGTGDPGCDAADQNGDDSVDPLDSGFVLARFGDCR